ncbi:hypothetical protein M1N79_03775 [Dehalococcoidia bacterium]|nr:hypothetical protein [Dehalococcoidia bacterium]
MKLKGAKTIALLLAAVILVIGSVAGMAAAGAGDSGGDEGWRMDTCYWWEALPISPHHQQQAREVGILIFDRYFGIDISAMSWQELDELWDEIGHENQKKAERLFAQYATEKGFEIPGIATPREEEEEFIPPPDATYWWEFLDPEYREHMIFQAKKTIPEALRCLWERLDWKGIELPIPRLDELDVMRLTPGEFETILRPRLPLGRVTVEQWLERFVPPSNIIAVFGRTRTYDDPTGWFDALREVRRLMRPLYPRLGELGVTSIGIIGAGYIDMHLDPGRLTPEDAKANAARIYAMIAPKAEMVGIEDVPVVFVWGAGRTRLALKTLRLCELHRGVTPVPGRLAIREVPTYLGGGASTFKDPREHIHTPLPLDQGFRPVPGGAQVAREVHLRATIGFPIRDPILSWDDVDLTTTGHLGPIINTPLYQPLRRRGYDLRLCE